MLGLKMVISRGKGQGGKQDCCYG